MRKKKEMMSRTPELNLTLSDSSAERVLDYWIRTRKTVECDFRETVAVC